MHRRPHPLAERGFALIALLALLIAGVLYFVVDRLDAAAMKRQQDETTARALAQAKDALIGYSLTYHDTYPKQVFGYLPCPDIDGDGSADALASTCGATDDRVVVGLLPYRQLGLYNYRDANGGCLWYVVSGTFKASSTGGTTPTLPFPTNWDTQGRLAVLDATGSPLVAPDDNNGGAAAVIIAAGPPLASQNRSGDPCAIANANSVYSNYLDGGYSLPSAAGVTVQLRQGESGSATNNDRLIWVTPREIFARIKSRTDHQDHMQSQIDSIVSALTAAMPTALSDHTLPANPFAANTSEYNFYANWQDHFRYFACATAGSYCYSVAGTSCDGILLFGGANASGTPRASTSRTNIDYFESADALALLGGTSTNFSGPSGYDGNSNTSRALDLGFCLKPPGP